MNHTDPATALRRLGADFYVRGWLSANAVIFSGRDAESTVIVDTGYVSHSAQTKLLVDRSLTGRRLDRIVNTHLHSDHCGGNAELQARHPGVRTEVPTGYRHALCPWNPTELSFRETGQLCERFAVETFLDVGTTITLGAFQWEVHGAGGHDADAVMFFEPRQRVLISGDALWEQRLAIIFPELSGEDGFGATAKTLDAIERLNPRVVLPGHGEPFAAVGAAIAQSRRRLEAFAAAPARHRDHAARALAMFHMLEARKKSEEKFLQWISTTPVFRRALAEPVDSTYQAPILARAAEVIEGLVSDRLLCRRGVELTLPDNLH